MAGPLKYRHQEFQFLLLDAVHCGTESEHHVLNDSHIFVSFTGILLLFGTKFQYSRKRRQDEEGKESNKAAIRDLVLTFCPTMRSFQQRKLKLLMLVYLNDRFIYFDLRIPYPFIYLKREKVTPFGRSFPVEAIIGSASPVPNLESHFR